MISILAHWSWSWFWNPSGKWYVFVSGFGSDLTELAIIGVLYKRLNCHVSGCYRLGLHHVPGTPYITCRKHHPTVPNQGITAEHISAQAAAASQNKGA